MFKPWLGLLLAIPATAQWSRVAFSGKGESVEVPQPHSLSYFTANPFLRDDGGDLCVDCSPRGRAKSALEYSIQPLVRPVGVLAGYRVLDVLYSVGKRNDPSRNEVNWKSILVQVGRDRYKEIFHLQASGGPPSLKPSSIINSVSERVLATMDFDGGVGGGCWEGYWWFNRAGPHSLDFSHLEAAIEEQIPKNTRFSINCSNVNLKSQTTRSGVQQFNPECNPCDWVGEVITRFRLIGPMAEPVAVKYRPGWP